MKLIKLGSIWIHFIRWCFEAWSLAGGLWSGCSGLGWIGSDRLWSAVPCCAKGMAVYNCMACSGCHGFLCFSFPSWNWYRPQLTGSWHQAWMDRTLCHSQGVPQCYHAMEWRFKQNELPVESETCHSSSCRHQRVCNNVGWVCWFFGFAKADVEQESCSIIFHRSNLLTALAEIVQENQQGSWGRQLAHSQLQLPKESKEQIESCKVVSMSVRTSFCECESLNSAGQDCRYLWCGGCLKLSQTQCLSI